MIFSVYIASERNNNNPVQAMNKNSGITTVVSAQFVQKNHIAAKVDDRSLSRFGKKEERLLHPIILQASIRHQLDPALIKAIIMAESGYNSKAVSKKGAKGLMQLMPKTAKSLGVEDIFNPKQNISGGVRYFKKLVNQFNGDITLALAAYNAGSSKVRRYQGIPPFTATKHYIKKVFKYYHLYKNNMTADLKRA
jgi:soluble lytic murein transglycosylase-like protein